MHARCAPDSSPDAGVDSITKCNTLCTTAPCADARWNPACDANKVHEWLVTPAAQIGPYMLHVHADRSRATSHPWGIGVQGNAIQTALQAASIRFPDLTSI